MNTISPKTRRALEILANAKDPLRGITANTFAVQYYSGTENEYLLSAVSNQGEGACAGKKAWLCAGSLLGKLAKKGLVNKRYHLEGPALFTLTPLGRKMLYGS